MANRIDPSASASHGQDVFPAIQGLRGLAVLLVLVYHLSPHLLPGGYVGVDVFFVISGFVITRSLLREANRAGTVSVSAFLMRRVRRLLPAAALVLVSVLVLTVLLLPSSRWPQIAREVLASALYFENWVLYADAVDYLAQEEVDSPVVHYWSLSIEEQFYLVWPVLVLAMVKLGEKAGLARRVGVLVAVAFAVSFTHSVAFTQVSAAQAYMSTLTRIWELAAGAGLACVVRRPSNVLSALLGAIGLGAIVVSAALFSDATPFPGAVALLPVGGAALVVLASSTTALPRALNILCWRPLTLTGDISYSLYLWHWPVMIFAAEALGRDPSAPELMVIGVLSFVLALATTFGFENRFRAGAFKIQTRRAAAFASAVAIGIPVLGSVQLLDRTNAELDMQLAAAQPGATALGTATAFAFDPLTFQPRPEAARKDLPDSYERDCHVPPDVSEVRTCSFGSETGKPHIALVGDSHAAQWLPALQAICEARDCRVTAVTKSSCPAIDLPLVIGKPSADFRTCEEWNSALPQTLQRMGADVVLVGMYRAPALRDPGGITSQVQDVAASSARIWSAWKRMGIQPITIADTPYLPDFPADCLSDYGQAEPCTPMIDDLDQREDPMRIGARLSNVPLIDLNAQICPDGTCHPVIGNVLVWRDRHHLSATYARTLAPVLFKRMRSAGVDFGPPSADE